MRLGTPFSKVSGMPSNKTLCVGGPLDGQYLEQLNIPNIANISHFEHATDAASFKSIKVVRYIKFALRAYKIPVPAGSDYNNNEKYVFAPEVLSTTEVLQALIDNYIYGDNADARGSIRSQDY
jgi:hypothetical protein